MAVTSELTLTGAWQAVATAGDAVITPSEYAIYALTGSTTAPAFDGGHRVGKEGMAMTLTGSERLWVKGPTTPGQDKLYVTADAPV